MAEIYRGQKYKIWSCLPFWRIRWKDQNIKNRSVQDCGRHVPWATDSYCQGCLHFNRDCTFSTALPKSWVQVLCPSMFLTKTQTCVDPKGQLRQVTVKIQFRLEVRKPACQTASVCLSLLGFYYKSENFSHFGLFGIFLDWDFKVQDLALHIKLAGLKFIWKLILFSLNSYNGKTFRFGQILVSSNSSKWSLNW